MIALAMSILLVAVNSPGPSIAATTATDSLLLEVSGWERTRALHVRVVDPRGKLSWRCDWKPGSTAGGVARCWSRGAWFTGPGRYVALVQDESPVTKSRVEEVPFEVTGREFRVEIRGSAERVRVLERCGSVASLRLDTSGGLVGILTNQGSDALYGAGARDQLSLWYRLERESPEGWVPSGIERDHRYTSNTGGMRPHEDLRIDLESQMGVLSPGTNYRFTTALVRRFEKGRPVQFCEAVSEPVRWDPGATLVECKSFHESHPTRALHQGWGPFLQLVRTEQGLRVISRNGEVSRLGPDGLQPVMTIPAGAVWLVGADGRSLIEEGRSSRLSSDGGRTFLPVELAGDRGAFFLRGSVPTWTGIDGVRRLDAPETPLLPRIPRSEAPPQAIAFRNERHGVMLRDCSVLLETTDGGAHWSEQPAPWPLLRDAFWWEEALWLAGPGGVFRRAPGSGRFERVLDHSQCQLGSGPGGLAAVCWTQDAWPWVRGYLFPKGGKAQPLAPATLPVGGYPADVDAQGLVTVVTSNAIVHWTVDGMNAIVTAPGFAQELERFRAGQPREERREPPPNEAR